MTLLHIDYRQQTPCIIEETKDWAVIYKPAHIPSAPLKQKEAGTVVSWFLQNTKSPAELVCGKKAVEIGLLHRLDTDTRGLLLFAKNQQTYNFFFKAQKNGLFFKTYCAFSQPMQKISCKYRKDTSMILDSAIRLPQTVAPHYGTPPVCYPFKQQTTVPICIASKFRNYGIKGKKTAPIFADFRTFQRSGKIYTTIIEAIAQYENTFRIQCRLSQGYRHQVRTHLSAIGLAIRGDPLYNTETSILPLQLYATKLVFPNPLHTHQNISVELPLPDKMTL